LIIDISTLRLIDRLIDSFIARVIVRVRFMAKSTTGVPSEKGRENAAF
jgi:hypothetical protein